MLAEMTVALRRSGACLLSLLLLALPGCGEGTIGGRGLDRGTRDAAVVARDAGAPGDAAGPLADRGAQADSSAEPPDAAPPPQALRFAVLSDINASYGSTTYGAAVKAAVQELIGRIKPDLVLITGDMVAGQQAGLDYVAMWKGFFSTVYDPLTAAGIPVAVIPGNHDASGYSSFAGERAIYVEQLNKKKKPAVTFVDAAEYPLRYSFHFRGVFFLALDVTTVAPLSAAQRAWADAQLAAAAQPVRIAFGHLPLHPVTVGRETEIADDPKLEQIFAKHGLAMYLSGHHHGYFPGVSGGVRQISVGCVGDGPRPLIGTSAAAPLSLVLVEIADDKVSSVVALRASAFTDKVTRGSLPAALKYGGHTLTRDDKAGF